MILIDPPAWPAHGRTWSHLASDTSLDELHHFAACHGIPRRSFEHDHYIVPEERYRELVEAGAQASTARELSNALVTAGIRRRRRRREELLETREVHDYYPHAGLCRIDVIASDLTVPAATTRPGWWVEVQGNLVRTIDTPRGWELPEIDAEEMGEGEPLGFVRIKLLDQPKRGYRGPWPWVFRPVRRPPRRIGEWRGIRDVRRRLGDHDAWPFVEWLTRPEL